MGVIVTPRVWLKKERSDYLYHQSCTFLFGKSTLKNSTVKRACLGAILGWVTSWEVSWAACERELSTPERLVDLWGQSSIIEAVIGKTCDHEGSGYYSWYQSRPATVSCASGWRAHGQSPSGAKILGVDLRSRGLVSRSVGEVG